MKRKRDQFKVKSSSQLEILANSQLLTKYFYGWFGLEFIDIRNNLKKAKTVNNENSSEFKNEKQNENEKRISIQTIKLEKIQEKIKEKQHKNENDKNKHKNENDKNKNENDKNKMKLSWLNEKQKQIDSIKTVSVQNFLNSRTAFKTGKVLWDNACGETRNGVKVTENWLIENLSDFYRNVSNYLLGDDDSNLNAAFSQAKQFKVAKSFLLRGNEGGGKHFLINWLCVKYSIKVQTFDSDENMFTNFNKSKKESDNQKENEENEESREKEKKREKKENKNQKEKQEKQEKNKKESNKKGKIVLSEIIKSETERVFYDIKNKKPVFLSCIILNCYQNWSKYNNKKWKEFINKCVGDVQKHIFAPIFVLVTNYDTRISATQGFNLRSTTDLGIFSSRAFSELIISENLNLFKESVVQIHLDHFLKTLKYWIQFVTPLPVYRQNIRSFLLEINMFFQFFNIGTQKIKSFNSQLFQQVFIRAQTTILIKNTFDWLKMFFLLALVNPFPLKNNKNNKNFKNNKNDKNENIILDYFSNYQLFEFRHSNFINYYKNCKSQKKLDTETDQKTLLKFLSIKNLETQTDSKKIEQSSKLNKNENEKKENEEFEIYWEILLNKSEYVFSNNLFQLTMGNFFAWFLDLNSAIFFADIQSINDIKSQESQTVLQSDEWRFLMIHSIKSKLRAFFTNLKNTDEKTNINKIKIVDLFSNRFSNNKNKNSDEKRKAKTKAKAKEKEKEKEKDENNFPELNKSDSELDFEFNSCGLRLTAVSKLRQEKFGSKKEEPVIKKVIRFSKQKKSPFSKSLSKSTSSKIKKKQKK